MNLSDFGVERQQTTLKNGTPVVVYYRPEMPISLRVAFLSGSRFDPSGKEGLAHFAEHMAFTGTTNFPSRVAIAEYIESKGAYFNASTGHEVMTIKFDYPDVEDTSDILELLREMIGQTIMSPETIEQERGTILSEMTRSKSNPARYVSFVWNETAFQGTPMGRSIIGDEESLASINQSDIRGYFTNKLQGNRAVIVASGGIEAEHLADYLNASPIMAGGKGRYAPDTIAPSANDAIKVARYPESTHAYLTLGLPSITLDHPGFQDFRLISRIFGASQVSRLRQRLRNDLGLVYAIGAGMVGYSSTGHFYISTDCHSNNLQQVLDVITEELIKIKKDGVTEVELDHVKNYLAKSQKMSLQTSDEWADYHVSRELLFPSLQTTIVDDLSQIANISSDDIKKALTNHLHLEGYTLAVCGDILAEDITVNV